MKKRTNLLPSRLFRIILNMVSDLKKQYVKSFCAAVLLLLISQFSFADNGESSRVLVHTLNYLSQDYAGAVKNGEIISESEFKEMKDFGALAISNYKELAPGFSKADSANIGAMVYRLDSLIEQHASFELVSVLSIQTRDKVIAASGLKITPPTYPSLANGKVVYKTECITCHGLSGIGDGPEGKGLNPPPRNMMDNEKMKPLSPFFVFNTVRLGVEGTGMKSHPALDDNQVWDVAFYVLSLRYEALKNDPFLKEQSTKDMLDSISLEKVSTTGDEEFVKSYGITDSSKAKLLLAAIRLNQPVQHSSDFINTAIKYLDGAMDLYNQGKFTEATQLSTLAYLEGIEPLEMQLKSNDPQLMSALEEQMHLLTHMMSQHKPAIEVNDSLIAAKKSIVTAGKLVDKKEYSFWLAFLMAVSILLREGLEAFLIIMVILSILKATELKNAANWVHAGWVLAILAGTVIWMVSGRVIGNQAENMELMEGIISLFAVFMLLYVGFWLHGKSEIGKWKEYVSKKMKGAVKNESMIGLAGLSFFVVFREVFESVLFLSALNIESAGKQSNAIVIGVITAFVVVIVMAVVILKFSAQLPIARLFKVSSGVMSILAVILAGKGVHSLQETGYASIHGLAVGRMELIGVFPTVETCAAQAVIILILLFVWNGSKLQKKTAK